MSRQVFTLPDLGEGLAEAELVRWLVRVGDPVAVDMPVAEVETAKATVELPSPYAGVIAELHGAEGMTIDVGAPLISVDPTGAGSTGGPAPSAYSAGPETNVAGTYLEEERAGSGNVLIGYGTTDEPSAPPRRRGRRAAATGPQPTALAPGGSVRPADRPRVKSPIVRQLARKLGLDLSTLTGTGPDGLITRADVEHASSPPVEHLEASQPATASPGIDQRTGLAIGNRVPLRGLRKAIADTLTRSRREIPEATTWVDVDATALLELRSVLAIGDRQAPGLLAVIARFVVAGLQRFPELNARVDTERDEIRHLNGVNLGIAAQTDRGLLVPAVRDAHRHSIRSLDTEIRRLTAAARGGTATTSELSSGSFTLNNYGVLGVDGSAAIINHPEVAILGVGRVLPRPWVVDGEIIPRHLTQLSLVFDHRVCDGGTAAGFLREVADAIESPMPALADL